MRRAIQEYIRDFIREEERAWRELLPPEWKSRVRSRLLAFDAWSNNRVRELLPPDWKPRLRATLLAFDAWLDTAVYESRSGVREGLDDYADFLERFRVRGLARAAVEVASESVTLSAGGLIVVLMLAVPTFTDTERGNFAKKSEISVTFLDRNGAEIGSRGVRR